MIEINTFGTFKVTYGDKVITDEVIRSDKLTKLLIFMVLNRKKTITMDEISRSLWQDEEIDNPAGALKNLMYRLRTVLKNTFGDEQFIISSRGSYSWNTDVHCSIDCENFDKLIGAAKDSTDIAESIENYEKAIKLYQGDFMPKILDMHWVIIQNAFYHSMYLTSVKELCELYLIEEKFLEMETLCAEALEIDRLDEQIYYYLITSRMKQNKLAMAMESYEKAKRLLSRELGVKTPAKLQEIYEKLLGMDNGSNSDNIETVHLDMAEEDEGDGPFFCGYPVFKEIYHLEARKIARADYTGHILFLTLVPPFDPSAGKMEAYSMRRIMKAMADVLKKALRIGDAVTKYSDTQYIVMLTACDLESAKLVCKRIKTNFGQEFAQYDNVEIKSDIEEIELAGKISKRFD